MLVVPKGQDGHTGVKEVDLQSPKVVVAALVVQEVHLSPDKDPVDGQVNVVTDPPLHGYAVDDVQEEHLSPEPVPVDGQVDCPERKPVHGNVVVLPV